MSGGSIVRWDAVKVPVDEINSEGQMVFGNSDVQQIPAMLSRYISHN